MPARGAIFGTVHASVAECGAEAYAAGEVHLRSYREWTHGPLYAVQVLKSIVYNILFYGCQEVTDCNYVVNLPRSFSPPHPLPLSLSLSDGAVHRNKFLPATFARIFVRTFGWGKMAKNTISSTGRFVMTENIAQSGAAHIHVYTNIIYNLM